MGSPVRRQSFGEVSQEKVSDTKNTKYEREENIGEIVALCDFDEQPTAYDVDKVIEQIEYRRANFDCKLCKYNDDEKTICSEDCSDALIDGLIEIVKGGGVE